MNRQNFKNYGVGNTHHLKPYRHVAKVKIETVSMTKDGVGLMEQIKDPLPHHNPYAQYKFEDIKIHTTKSILEEQPKTGEITIVRNPDSYKHKKAFTNWHQHRSYVYNDPQRGNQELSISDSVGGCGMQQLYGWTSIYDKEVALKLINFMLDDLHNGVGLIICQLGKEYFKDPFEQALIECGFECQIKYKNWMHGDDGKYKQKVYMKVIDK